MNYLLDILKRILTESMAEPRDPQLVNNMLIFAIGYLEGLVKMDPATHEAAERAKAELAAETGSPSDESVAALPDSCDDSLNTQSTAHAAVDASVKTYNGTDHSLNSNSVTSLDLTTASATSESNDIAAGQTDSVTITFEKKEINSMSASAKKILRMEGFTVTARVRKTGKKSVSYNIRFHKCGYSIDVSATNIELLKEKFITELKKQDEAKKNPKPVIPDNFDAFASYCFENFRKGRISEQTYNNDIRRYNRCIKPVFQAYKVCDITSEMCQTLASSYFDAGKEKTAEEICIILRFIFNLAVRHHLIQYSPMDIVFLKKHEREHGHALTVKEEKLLFENISDPRFKIMVAVSMYTGLRPNELKTARIEDGCIIAHNSKQKNGKYMEKTIPISPMLAPYLVGVDSLFFFGEDWLRKELHKVLPGHKLYDLRTTFYTRCQECGVAEVAIKVMAGHSLGGLANTYTDLSVDFLKKEIQKFNYVL